MTKLIYLKWESEFFNKKVFLLKQFQEDISKNKLKYDLIESSVKLDEKEKIKFLEKNDFKLEELSIKFKKKIEENYEINFEYQKADKEDIKNLINFSKFFIQSRFNIFGKEKVIEFYSEWIRNSILGSFDDVCFFLKDNNKIIGLITLKNLDFNEIRIGLIVVHKDFQRKGIGKKLLMIAEDYCIKNKKINLFVTTQGTNIKAQNFYIKNGFFVSNINVWYYLLKERLV